MKLSVKSVILPVVLYLQHVQGFQFNYVFHEYSHFLNLNWDCFQDFNHIHSCLTHWFQHLNLKFVKKNMMNKSYKGICLIWKPKYNTDVTEYISHMKQNTHMGITHQWHEKSAWYQLQICCYPASHKD